MTRRRRAFAIIGVALAVAVPLVFYLVFRAGGPAYHNACIERAMTSAVEIEIRHKAWQSPDHVPRIVTIKDRKRIMWLLDRLRLPPSLHIEGQFHKCGGHLAVTIRTEDDAFHLSYDHGDGMYPISRGRPPGFVDMDPRICGELNEYFQSIGFTEEELGIH